MSPVIVNVYKAHTTNEKLEAGDTARVVATNLHNGDFVAVLDDADVGAVLPFVEDLHKKGYEIAGVYGLN